jgi:hypothetical protein
VVVVPLFDPGLVELEKGELPGSSRWRLEGFHFFWDRKYLWVSGLVALTCLSEITNEVAAVQRSIGFVIGRMFGPMHTRRDNGN